MWRYPAEILSRAGILGHRVHQNGGSLKPSGNVVVFIPSRFAFKAMVVITVVRITVAIAILHASGSVAVPVAGSHRIVAMSFLWLLVVVVVIVLLLMVRRGFELPPGRMLKFVRRLPVAWDLMV